MLFAAVLEALRSLVELLRLEAPLTRVAVLAGRGVSILTVVQPTREALWSTVVALHFQNEPPPELLTTRAAVLGPRRRADDLVLFNFSIDPDRGVHVQ